MIIELRALVPDPDVLLSLEVEELAGVLLMHLNSRGDGGADLHHYNFFNHFRIYPVYENSDPSTPAPQSAARTGDPAVIIHSLKVMF